MSATGPSRFHLTSPRRLWERAATPLLAGTGWKSAMRIQASMCQLCANEQVIGDPIPRS